MLKTNPAWIKSQGDSLALEVARRRPETNPFIASARFAVDITAGVGWARRDDDPAQHKIRKVEPSWGVDSEAFSSGVFFLNFGFGLLGLSSEAAVAVP
jgi:hypothetical protein